jgi:hypothetical protein
MHGRTIHWSQSCRSGAVTPRSTSTMPHQCPHRRSKAPAFAEFLSGDGRLAGITPPSTIFHDGSDIVMNTYSQLTFSASGLVVLLIHDRRTVLATVVKERVEPPYAPCGQGRRMISDGTNYTCRVTLESAQRTPPTLSAVLRRLVSAHHIM